MHKGEMHQGIHVPMISKKTFDEIQTALKAVSKPRKRKHAERFKFLDFAACGSCGYSITAERQTKKKTGFHYDYYRCTHKSKERVCEGRTYTREDRLAEEIKRNMELVVLPEEWKEKYLAQIEVWEGQDSQIRQKRIDSLRQDLNALKAKIERITTGFVEGSLSLEEFKELKNPLLAEKVGLEEKIMGLERGKARRLEPLKEWVLEANKGEKTVSDENWEEMKSFLKKVGSNRLLRAQTLTVSFKKPWDLLAQTTIAARSAPDRNSQSPAWCTVLGSNQRPSACEADALPLS